MKPCAHWINVEVQTNFGGHGLSGFVDMVQIRSHAKGAQFLKPEKLYPPIMVCMLSHQPLLACFESIIFIVFLIMWDRIPSKIGYRPSV